MTTHDPAPAPIAPAPAGESLPDLTPGADKLAPTRPALDRSGPPVQGGPVAPALRHSASDEASDRASDEAPVAVALEAAVRWSAETIAEAQDAIRHAAAGLGMLRARECEQGAAELHRLADALAALVEIRANRNALLAGYLAWQERAVAADDALAAATRRAEEAAEEHFRERTLMRDAICMAAECLQDGARVADALSHLYGALSARAARTPTPEVDRAE